jgi:hypothetical protein
MTATNALIFRLSILTACRQYISEDQLDSVCDVVIFATYSCLAAKFLVSSKQAINQLSILIAVVESNAQNVLCRRLSTIDGVSSVSCFR